MQCRYCYLYRIYLRAWKKKQHICSNTCVCAYLSVRVRDRTHSQHKSARSHTHTRTRTHTHTHTHTHCISLDVQKFMAHTCMVQIPKFKNICAWQLNNIHHTFHAMDEVLSFIYIRTAPLCVCAGRLQALASICPCLTSLDLSHRTSVDDNIVSGALQGLTALQQLKINNCPAVTDNAFQGVTPPLVM